MNLLSEVRKTTGIEALTADETGLASVRVDDTYNMNLQFVKESGQILCFVEVASLPPDAPKSVYQELLAGSLFGKETAGGYFSLESSTQTVVYCYFFDLETAAKDVDAFVAALERAIEICDIWAKRIRDMLAGGEGDATDGEEAEMAVLPDSHAVFMP